MTKEEVVQVFKKYLKTSYVPNPFELQEASKLAIKALTLTDKELLEKESETII